MITETQDTVYFQRMKSSLGDKSAILDYLVPGTVLDFGAGGGDLSESIRLHNYDVIAVDGSPAAIQKIRENYPNVNAVQSMGHELLQHFSENSFDNIVCCSILHEVYSYGDDRNLPYDLTNISRMLEIFGKLLRPGGRLIIRDGVAPADKDKKAVIHFTTDDGMKFFNAYKNSAPFYSNDDTSFGKVHFDVVDDHTIRGSMSSVMEFLYTYTWGWGSIERESQEFYGVLSLDDYSDMLRVNSWGVLHSEEYLQQGYVDHLSKLVNIVDAEGNEVPFPPSNMLIVAEK